MSGRKRENREEQAFRILEALSGADGELLERSEGTSGAKGVARLYRFAHKYGRACAACFCLLVLGAAFWAVNAVSSKQAADYSGNTAAQTESLMEAPQTAGAAAADGAVEAAEAETARAGETGAEEGADAGKPAEDLTQAVNSLQGQGAPAAENAETASAEQAAEEVQKQEAPELSWEEAYQLEPFGKYIPESLPEGYGPQTAVCGVTEEGGNSLTLTWGNGEKTFTLRLAETDGAPAETGQPVYSAGGDWKKEIPEAAADGFVSFCLLFPDGVLAEYEGCLTEEELVSLLEGIGNE